MDREIDALVYALARPDGRGDRVGGGGDGGMKRESLTDFVKTIT